MPLTGMFHPSKNGSVTAMALVARSVSLMENELDMDQVDEIIDRYTGQEGVLIQLLLDLQTEFNWIPRQAISRVSERLKIPPGQVYRIASFYKAMSLSPMGRHKVHVCMGTACIVRGSQRILDLAESSLGIRVGGTTPDMEFSLRSVNCLGCCAMGPVVVVDDQYHGNMTTEGMDDIMKLQD